MAFLPASSGGLFSQGAFQIDPDMTPEQIQRRREMLASMMPRYGQARYVGEGLGHLATGVLQGRQMRNLDKAEGKERSRISDMFGRLMGGGTATEGAPILGPTQYTPPDPNSPEGIAGEAMVALGKRSPYADAIAAVESAGSGDYSALGPTTKSGDRAYGRYQVMGANVGPWTEKYLGKRMTPEEFLASPEAQDAVFNGEFGSYVQKYGNPQDAASMWFSGRPMAEAGNASDGYNTVPQYVDKFTRAMGGPERVTPAGGGMDIATLAEIASSPYADPGQRQVAQILLQQQLQAADPSARLDLEYKRAQLDALKNPPPKPVSPTDDMREYEFAKSQGYKGSFIDFRAQNRPGGATEYGLTPQFVTDAKGELRMLQLAKDGTAKLVDIPDGMEVQKGVEKLDLGTHFQWYNTVTGEPIGNSIPKEVRAEEREKALGKGEGEATVQATADLPNAIAKAEQSLALIDTIRNDPALAGITGMFQGRLPPLTQAGTDLNTKIENLKGKVFLEAFESLKGGGQITEREGVSAQAAMARLDRAQSRDAYVEALDELAGIIRTAVARAQSKAGVAPAAAHQVAPAEDEDLFQKYGVTR